MKNKLPDWLVVTIWHALLGEIYPSIRAIAISFSESKKLTIRYYLEKDPTEFDFESIEVVATNISAATELDLIKEIDVDCQQLAGTIGSADHLDGFIYCRREYDL